MLDQLHRKPQRRFNHNQSLYAILNEEVENLFERESIELQDNAATIQQIVNLFFQIVGIKQYDNMNGLLNDIRDIITIPIILAKEYARAHDLPVEHLITKAVSTMQTNIKEYISSPPKFKEPLPPVLVQKK